MLRLERSSDCLSEKEQDILLAAFSNFNGQLDLLEQAAISRGGEIDTHEDLLNSQKQLICIHS